MTMLLIAEDDDDVRFGLERIFTRIGFTVHTAVDGAAALHLASALRPDVVLTDLDMPRMTGLELCRAIRADPHLRDVPVAILSGSIYPGDRRPAEARACLTLSKPIGNKKLVAEIRRLVDEGRHAHDGAAPCLATAAR